MPRLELNILGCGSAKPTARHLPSCQVLNVRDNLLMIDCGEGAQMAMARQRLKFSRLRHIFISHLHGDHWFGLPGLLSTLALHELTGRLTIHIFGDGARLLREVAKYAGGDGAPYDLEFNVIGTQPARIHEDNAITVDTITLNHRVPAVGFIIREKPKLRHINPDATCRLGVPHWAMNSLRQGQDYITPEGVVVPNAQLTSAADPSVSYAYCSDTRPSRRVVEAIGGVDWLYHEATYGDECQRQAHARYHSTAREAAQVAHDAGVKHLILGHYSSRYDNEEPLLRQAQEVFADTRLAREGMVVDLLEQK